MRGGICLVPLTNAVSGTERVLADIAEALAQQGQDVSALIPRFEGGDRLDRYAADLQHIAPGTGRMEQVHGARSPLKNLLLCWRFFRRNRPQIVHFHCPHYRWGLEVVIAASLARVPRILRTEHNPLMGPPGRLFAAPLAWADREVTTFTYVSRGNQARYEALLPRRRGRGRVICNGVDPERFAPGKDAGQAKRVRAEFGFPENSRIAIHISAFGGRRPLTPIFEAFRSLLNDPRTRGPAEQWRILIVGEGDEAQKTAPERLEIAPFVHFAGRREDVARILPQCDLYVNASHFEGLASAMLEAWAAGLPVLTTDVDGVSDVIGEAGPRPVVPIGDSAAFAAAWWEAMTGLTDRLPPQQAATRTVREQFTTARMVADYLSLYRGAAETVAQGRAVYAGN